MKRPPLVVTGLAVIVIAAAIGFVLSSNLLVRVGKAAFSTGERDLNKLEITAPYGWYCIEYEKTMTVPNSSELHVAGTGISDCPLFGPDTILSNNYPDHGTTEVPLDQPTRVYQSENQHYEIYVLITKDRTKYEQLDGQ